MTCTSDTERILTADEQYQLFVETEWIRRYLKRTAGEGLVDVEAELALAAWEAITAGVVDRNRIYIKLDRHLRKLRRRVAAEVRLNHRYAAGSTPERWGDQSYVTSSRISRATHHVDDPAETVPDEIARRQQVDGFRIPTSVAPWVARRFFDADIRLSAREYRAGARWLQSVRQSVGSDAA